MNQSIRKSNAGSKPRPSVSTQPHKNIVVRPKRCHNCQKMIAADKYDQHYESCYRMRESQKIINNQSRAISVAETQTSANKNSILNTTQSRVINGGNKIQKGDANYNKNRLVVNNNVVIPGKATSNITRKGPHKNIINSNIAQRTYKKNQNPQSSEKKQIKKENNEDESMDNLMRNQVQQIKKEQISRHNELKSERKQKKQQKQQEHLYQTQLRTNRPASNIRVHSRPGSSTRPSMQVRVVEQGARLADLYNGSFNRPRADQRDSIVPRMNEIRRPHQRRVSLSSESGYQSSQLIRENQSDLYYLREDQSRDQDISLYQRERMEQEKRVERERIRIQELQRQRQRQIQRQRQREIWRERERQRERQRQRQRERERQRQRERQQQRERQRERQQDRRQIQQQMQQPRVNLQILVQSTQQIIHFVQQLTLQDDSLTDMLLQLRQLNAISSQIVQLNGLGRNLGFRMGVVFAQRIQELQNVIMNQIGIVLIRNFHDNITEDFERLMSLRPRQPIIIQPGIKKQQLNTVFPIKNSTSQDECSICLDQIKYRQQIRQLQCHHIFHPDCIDGWLQTSIKCPMCRHEQKIR